MKNSILICVKKYDGDITQTMESLMNLTKMQYDSIILKTLLLNMLITIENIAKDDLFQMILDSKSIMI